MFRNFTFGRMTRKRCVIILFVVLVLNIAIVYVGHVNYKTNKNVLKSFVILRKTTLNTSAMSMETSSSSSSTTLSPTDKTEYASNRISPLSNFSSSKDYSISNTNTSSRVTIQLKHNKLVELFTNAHVQTTVWKKESFCDKFIGRTFSKQLEVCKTRDKELENSIECVGSSMNNKMIVCTVRNVLVRPEKLKSAVWECDACKIDKSGAFNLILNNETKCSSPATNSLQPHSERNDPTYRSMLSITSEKMIEPIECQQWINKTAYFFHSQRFHIYFRFLSYYNLYKTLLDTGAEPGAEPGDFLVVRMAEAQNYKFDDFERSLFPDMMRLTNFSATQRVCFKRIVFSPWAYASVMFRCKMEKDLKGKCLECEGKDRHNSSLLTFRTRALEACSLSDSTPTERKLRTEKNVVFVKRKPYTRWSGDKHHNFQRVLSNEDEVLKVLKSDVSGASVHDVYMEDLDLCEQMRLVHNCDVFVGVHGAGLVHLWWLQDDATLLELVPPDSSRNLSFKTLAKLAGRNYRTLSISGSKFRVKVDTNAFLKTIKNILSEKR